MKKAGYNQWAKDVLEYIDLNRTREDAEALGLANKGMWRPLSRRQKAFLGGKTNGLWRTVF